jgi:hypothetical protein
MNNYSEDLIKSLIDFLPQNTKSVLMSNAEIRRSLFPYLLESYSHIYDEIEKLKVSDYIEMSEGGLLRLIQQRNENNWELALVIDEGTTLEEIKQDWHNIINYRKALVTLQGTTQHSVLDFYLNEHKSGKSYKQISEDINFESLVYLVHAFLNQGESDGLIYELGIHFLLHEFGVKQVSSIIDEGIQVLRINRLPWTRKTGPMDSLRVRDSLRYHSTRREKSAIGNSIFNWLPHTQTKITELQDAVNFIEKLEKIG